MALCSLNVAANTLGMTMRDVRSSVNSFLCSSKYMRKLVPLTVYNIIYHRTNMDPDFFVSRKIADFEFKTFRPKIRNNIIADVYWWCKGAADAIEKKYLKELYLYFMNKSGDGKIIEHFKYTFEYKDRPPAGEISSNDVLDATKNLFTTIESMGSLDKLPDDVDILIEVTLVDNIPKDYNPSSFDKTNGFPLITQIPSTASASNIVLGSIDTGYHSLKCVGQSKLCQSQPHEDESAALETWAAHDEVEEQMEVVPEQNIIEPEEGLVTSLVPELNSDETIMELDVIDQEDTAEPREQFILTPPGLNLDAKNEADETLSVEVTFEPNDENFQKTSTVGSVYSFSDHQVSLNIDDNIDGNLTLDGSNSSDTIECQCRLSSPLLDFTTLITCTICGKIQHTICVGYKNIANVKKPYICVECADRKSPRGNNKNRAATDFRLAGTKRSGWNMIAAFRIVAWYCYKYKTFPTKIVQQFNNHTKKIVNKQVKNFSGLIFNDDNSCTIDPALISEDMSAVFYDFGCQDSSLTLGDDSEALI